MSDADAYTARFRFRLEQEVRIVALKLPGRIIARCQKVNAVPSYEVIWWADGQRHDEWLFEFELGE
ncbi:MAG TPA: hypothetical protein VJ464_15945 [Blastocatellia bacterium]|nr:hypothetical protein [Blastocatellia bacterium]